MLSLVHFEPRITFTCGLFSTGVHVSSGIALQVTIIDPTGNQVFSTIVQGDSFLADDKFLGVMGGDEVTLIEKTTRKAIEKAMQQLSIAISDSRQLHDVFENRHIRRQKGHIPCQGLPQKNLSLSTALTIHSSGLQTALCNFGGWWFRL